MITDTPAVGELLLLGARFIFLSQLPLNIVKGYNSFILCLPRLRKPRKCRYIFYYAHIRPYLSTELFALFAFYYFYIFISMSPAFISLPS